VAQIDVRQDGADYNRLPNKWKDRIATLFGLGFLFLSRHIQVNAPALAITPLVQSRNDFFHRLQDGCALSLLVSTNGILTLLNDVAMPVRANHIPGRI
jgi:hypothetical protein